ncbi:hypothetical protein [Streptomyces natalensis]|uniref:Acyl carrier protein n=1 Tax=Streptomyces natalensis ATCC 27448 TaxID=1240678 RepID=A0A0D7CUK5_9ACTN|nr:hypothetical protein [Streptomyces natalensis]KIZ19535.1 hypothetical protein SNA_03240 [Streptomyces natalensis ATCC 27448]
MEKLCEVFVSLFKDRVGDIHPDGDTVVFGSESAYGLESMDTLRFVSALLPLYGDKVYDLEVEGVSTLKGLYEQLQGA